MPARWSGKLCVRCGGTDIDHGWCNTREQDATYRVPLCDCADGQLLDAAEIPDNPVVLLIAKQLFRVRTGMDVLFPSRGNDGWL